ncbi:MAG: transferase, partial [Eubacterium sp.]
YSDYFFFYQGCTVGGNKGKYPTIGKNVTMFSNSSILGESYVGEHVVISTGTLIKDENIPDYSLVFGQSPELIIKQKDKEYMIHMSQQFWNKEYNG